MEDAMKTIIMYTLTLACFVHGFEFSHRIRALGTDFANLIPDYETDLYRNPQLLESSLAAVSYEPTLAYYYRPYGYYPIYTNYAPLNLALLTGRFGVTGQYWFDYSYDLEPIENSWASSTYQAYRIQDLWLSRIKNLVVNIYNDLDYSKIEYLASTNSQTEDRKLEYIIKGQVSMQIRKRLSLDLKLGLGVFQNVTETNEYDTYNKMLTIGLARLGLYGRHISHANDFTSWYLEIGSPLTNTEMDALPYSVYSRVANNESEFVLFANTVISRFGAAKTVPIGDRGFLAIGFTDAFLMQETEEHGDLGIQFLKGVVNTMSIPAAVEYPVNTISLRFGTKISYTFKNLREFRWTVDTQNLMHTLTYDFSFGIGWQPVKRLVIDLYNDRYLSNLEYWAIYLKYIF
jgi:hypothetical protein